MIFSVMKVGAVHLLLKGGMQALILTPSLPSRPLESEEELNWKASFHLLNLREGNLHIQDEVEKHKVSRTILPLHLESNAFMSKL